MAGRKAFMSSSVLRSANVHRMRARFPATASVVVATAIVAVATALPAAAQELDVAAFREYARDAIASFQVPGAAVSVVHDGEVVLAEGFGVRELGGEAAVDGDTLFAIASNTKAFTTALLASLVDEGTLSWDDRVVDHLPELRLDDPYVTRELTVRDLLSHRAGFRSGLGDLLWLRTSFSREEILHRMRYLRRPYGFRERYGYSNVAYIVAGELAERLAGTTWDELVVSRVLEPLGMRSSNTSVTHRTPDGNWATPHVYFDGAVRAIAPENVDNLGGAGAINSSARDIARWLLLQLGRGEVDGVRVFSEERSRELWTPVTLMPNSEPPKALAAQRSTFAAYALGWRVGTYRGTKLVHHGGGLAGMTSRTTMAPDIGLGIVVFTNQETSLQTALTYRILDAYLGAPETDWVDAHASVSRARGARATTRLDEVAASRRSGTQPRLPLSDYAGRYAEPIIGGLRISEEDGSLTLQFENGPAYRAQMEHWHLDTFVARFNHHSIADAFLTFELAPDGRVRGARMSTYSPFSGSTYHYDVLTLARQH